MNALKVWVAYASPTQQFNVELPFRVGMTAAEAIERSGIAQHVEGIEDLSLGIFGVKIKNAQHVLNAGDRVEIYRALTINPKDIRRNRAAKNPVGRYAKGHKKL